MSRIPKSAKLVKWHAGVVQRGPHAGKQVDVKLFEGDASQGHRSDYQPVPHRWVWVRIGDYENTHQFSGRNYEKAVAFYNDGLEVTNDDGETIVKLEPVLDREVTS